MDCSPPGSSVPGILQARILEWVAISLYNARMHAVASVMSDYTAAHQAPLSLGFSRQEYWSGSPFPSLLLPDQALNVITPDGRIAEPWLHFGLVPLPLRHSFKNVHPWILASASPPYPRQMQEKGLPPPHKL